MKSLTYNLNNELPDFGNVKTEKLCSVKIDSKIKLIDLPDNGNSNGPILDMSAPWIINNNAMQQDLWSGPTFAEKVKLKHYEAHQIEEKVNRGIKVLSYDIYNNTQERNGKLHDMLDSDVPNFLTSEIDMFVDIESLINGRFKWYTMTPRQYKTLVKWHNGEAKILDFLIYDPQGREKLDVLASIHKHQRNKWKEIVAKLQSVSMSKHVAKIFRRKTHNISQRILFKKIQQGVMNYEQDIHKHYNLKAYDNYSIFAVDLIHIGKGDCIMNNRFVCVATLRKYVDAHPLDTYIRERYNFYCKLYNIYQPQAINLPQWAMSFGNDFSNALRSFGNFIASIKAGIVGKFTLIKDWVLKLYDLFKNLPQTMMNTVSSMRDFGEYAIMYFSALMFILIGALVPHGHILLSIIEIVIVALDLLNIYKTNIKFKTMLNIISYVFNFDTMTTFDHTLRGIIIADDIRSWRYQSRANYQAQAINFDIASKCVAAGAAFLLCKYLPFEHTMMNFLNKCDKIPKAIFGMEKLIECFDTFIRDNLSGVYERITGETYTPDTAIPEIVKENYAEVKKLALLATYSTMASDPGKCIEIENVYHKYLSLRSEFSGNRKVCDFMNAYTGTIVDLFKKAAAANPRVNSERAKPTVVMLKGTTGVGKSALVYFLAASILKHYGCLEGCTPEQMIKKVNECVYARNGKQEFFDGYLNQLVCVMDDFGCMKDTITNPNSDFEELLRMGNNFPYPLPMASINQKANTFFTSRFLFLTTNLSQVNPVSMINPEALRSRIAFTYHIKIKREWQVNPDGRLPEDYRLDVNKVRAAYGNKTTIDVYEFDKIDIITGNTLRTGLSYADVIKEIIDHRTSEENFFLNKQESIVSFLNETTLDIEESNAARAIRELNNLAPSSTYTAQDNINFFELYRCSSLARFFVSAGSHHGINKFKTDFVTMQMCIGDAIYEKLGDIPIEEKHKYLEELCKIEHVNRTHFLDWDLWTDLQLSDETLKPVSEYKRKIWNIPQEFLSERIMREIAAHYQAGMNYLPLNSDMEDYLEHITTIENLYDYYLDNVEEFDFDMEVETANRRRRYVNEYNLRTTSIMVDGIVFFLTLLGVITGLIWVVKNAQKNTEKYVQKHFPDKVNEQLINQIRESVPPESQEGVEEVIQMAIGDKIITYDQAVKYIRSIDIQDDNLVAACNILIANAESGIDKKNLIKHRVESGMAKKDIVRHRVECSAESYTSVQAEEVSKMVRKHFRDIKYYGKTLGKIVMIKGRWALMNKHYLHKMSEIPDTDIILVTMPGMSQGTEIQMRHIRAGRQILRGEDPVDLWAFEMPRNVAQVSDLVKHFHTKGMISHVDEYSKYVMVVPDGTQWHIKTTNLVKNHRVEIRLGEHEGIKTYRALNYEFDVRSVPGDCGGLYLADNNSFRNKIIGFHFAGNKNGGGCAVPLVKDDFSFLDAVECIAHSPLVDIGVCPRLPLDGIIPLGTARPVHSAVKTSIVKTKLYNRIYVSQCEPARLGKMLEEGGAGIRGLNKVLPTVPYIDDKEVELACEEFKTKILSGKKKIVRVLTFEEAVSGEVPEDALYVKGINRSTSAGYPYCLETKNGKKKYFGSDNYVFGKESNEIKMRVENLIRRIVLENEYEQCIYMDTLKDETRSIEKVRAGKTRVFSAAPMDFVILFRMYFLGFLNHVMEHKILNEVAVGTCAQSTDWNKLALTLLQKGNNIVAGDFSNYDGTLNPSILWAVCDLANEYYRDGNEKIRRLIFEDIVHSIHIAEDQVYGWTHSQPSGNPGTAIINSIYNSLACRIVYNRIFAGDRKYYNRFSKYVAMVSYGDDNLLSIDSEILHLFNQQSMTRGFEQIGMVYTDETKQNTTLPCKTLQTVSFLKRGFLFKPEISLWVSPLTLGSILERTNWQHKHPTPEAVTIQNCEAAIVELALHDKDIFIDWTRKIKDQVAEVFKLNLPIYPQEYYLDLVATGKMTEVFDHLSYV